MSWFRKTKEEGTYPSRQTTLRKEARSRRRKRFIENSFTKLLIGLAAIGIIGVIVLLSAVVTYFGWNHGVVNVIKACGGDAGGISLTTAVFTNMALAALRGGNGAKFKTQ